MDEIQIISTGRYERVFTEAERIGPIKMGELEFKVECGPLSVEIVEKATTELRETKENIVKAFEEIRELLKGEPDLYFPDDDYFFVKFLRPCKWYAKSAFELMKRFYHFRRTRPQLWEDFVPSIDKETFATGLFTVFPKRTKDGCRVILIETGPKWDPKVTSLDQFLRSLMKIAHFLLLEPTTQVCGFNVIFDMDKLSLTQVSYIRPSFAIALTDWFQNCEAERLKDIHIINQPYIWNILFPVFKPFLKAKYSQRIHLHGKDRQSLMTYINKEALPCRYGGQMNLPDEPVGELLWKYMCLFEREYVETNNFGYENKK